MLGNTNFLFKKTKDTFKKEENVVDTLLRIGEAKTERVVYALQTDGYVLTVYKMPKAFPTMKAWLAELKRSADNAVKQQLAAADEETTAE
ncbi:MAG: hypothetical protein PHF79_02490 [Candidatus Pacebacteria bacterium]|nr:hypothetical protein [Candidatus Paceibacterota bacterium]